MQKDIMHFHIYIICYIYYNNVNLETWQLMTYVSTGMHTTTLNTTELRKLKENID